MSTFPMLKKSPLTFISGILLFFAADCQAQYYYKDVVVTNQINAGYRLMRDNKVTHVSVVPADLDPSEKSVMLEQTVQPAQRLVVTYTKVPDAPESWLKSYYNEKGLLARAVDSSLDVVTTTLYEYDEKGMLNTISSNSIPVNDPAEKEVHRWTYNSNGQPVKMIKIKDGIDSTIVTFTLDEQGNAAEEKPMHKQSPQPTIYYYYDAGNRLTDVARYNVRAKRILPDYMFEYNDAKQVSQMVVVPEGSSDYQTWKYFYNPQQLKEKEVCYNKQRQLVANIGYTYTFGK